MDLSGEPEAGITASRWMDERARKVFDLSSRCHDSCLLKLGEKQWIWFFNIHHLIADAWSVALICRHIGDYYDWLRAGKPLPDEPLPAFLDYRRHEQAWRKGDAFVRARSIGRRNLQSLQGSSRFTVARAREVIPPAAGLRYRWGGNDRDSSTNLPSSRAFVGLACTSADSTSRHRSFRLPAPDRRRTAVDDRDACTQSTLAGVS